MLCLSLSFSQEAKEALRASVIFLVVPGVSGGTGAGISGGGGAGLDGGALGRVELSTTQVKHVS